MSKKNKTNLKKKHSLEINFEPTIYNFYGDNEGTIMYRRSDCDVMDL